MVIYLHTYIRGHKFILAFIIIHVGEHMTDELTHIKYETSKNLGNSSKEF